MPYTQYIQHTECNTYICTCTESTYTHTQRIYTCHTHNTHKRRSIGGKKKTWCKKRISCNDKAIEQQNNQKHPSAWWKSEILSSKTRYWKVFMGI